MPTSSLFLHRLLYAVSLGCSIIQQFDTGFVAALCLMLFLSQIAVDYSTERKCWLDMIRLWAIHMTHDPYMRSLSSNRNSVLQTIIASHRRSQQVRKRLQLRQLNYNTAEAAGAGTPNVAVEGQRLPAQYQPLVSGARASSSCCRDQSHCLALVFCAK